MTKGQKLIYGFHDKKRAIPCTYTGKWELLPDGEIVIYATCDGGTIKAPLDMFKEVRTDNK